MKTFSCSLALFLASFSLKASTPTDPIIYQAIENHMNSVFMDTVEEGDIFATILRPESSCFTSLENKEKGLYRHYCVLQIEVEDRNWEPFNQCETSCKVNFFSYKNNPTELDSNSRQVEYCLENINEGC